MKKYNDFQKFDLALIKFVESIEDRQAEALSAGSFLVSSRRRTAEFESDSLDQPGEAFLAFDIDANTPSLSVINTTFDEEGNGRFFQVEFTTNNGRRTLASGTLFTGGRVRRQTIKRAVANGATGIQITQQDTTSLPPNPNVNSSFL